jgi:hypothetical protein
MEQQKNNQKLTIDAYRIELSDFKVIGFLPLKLRTYLSLGLNQRLSQFSYLLSKKQFISKDVAKFQYAIYKEAIITFDSMYFLLKTKSNELLEANRKEKEEYLIKASEYLSKYDEKPDISAIFETKANGFDVNKYFNQLDLNLSKQNYVTPEWVKSASKIKDLLSLDLNNQAVTMTESKAYFVLCISISSHQDEKIEEGYLRLIEARSKITENLLLAPVTPDELVDYTTNHYIETEIIEVN